MQLKFFTLSIFLTTEEEENLNKFLRSVKVLEIKRELVNAQDSVFWAVSVLYIPQGNIDSNQPLVKGKIDYKNILSESEFAKFCQFRKIRKTLAEEDAVPAYAIFTDSELADISRLTEVSSNSLKQVNGIGPKKLEKYGMRFCEMYDRLIQNEKGGELVQ